MEEELIRNIANRQAILFVGSGVSAGLGAPTFNALIDEIGRQLGYDPNIFKGSGASYLSLAEFYALEKGGIGPLRSWMDREWQRSGDQVASSEAHKLITKLSFPVIYTTNYDSYIEQIHQEEDIPYNLIVSIRDFIGRNDDYVDIVKFHGDFQSDDSIVLTEKSYFDRLDFSSPLDIRLRSDVIGRSILFIGYSLNDINMRLMLYKLWKLWSDSGFSKERPKSFLFLAKPDPIQEKVLESWGVSVLTSEEDDPGKALATFLRNLSSKVSQYSS